MTNNNIGQGLRFLFARQHTFVTKPYRLRGTRASNLATTFHELWASQFSAKARRDPGSSHYIQAHGDLMRLDIESITGILTRLRS